LPLVRPPWGRITAIDMNKGEFLWQKANGPASDVYRNNPAVKGSI
jgi:quinoprotein glucose dehydrogenase